jgi:hypothetical protein
MDIPKTNFGTGMSHVQHLDGTGGQSNGSLFERLGKPSRQRRCDDVCEHERRVGGRWLPPSLIVDYPPGSVDPIHRHNAHAFVYVLEGSIVMQVRGGKEVTLTPGQTFYEGPDDVQVGAPNRGTHKNFVRPEFQRVQ